MSSDATAEMHEFRDLHPRIAVCSWSLAAHSPNDLVTRLQQIGIPKVQLAISPLIHDPSQRDGVIESLAQSGIEIVSGMMAMAGEDYSSLESIARTGGLRPNDMWPDNLDHARVVADAAKEFNIGLVTFHAGFIPHEQSDSEREILLQRLRTVADIFAECGVRIALETGQETALILLDMLNDLDRSNVGINFDPANMILYGKGDPIEAMELLSPHIVQVHVKDAIPTKTPGTWGREVPAGEGAVDWQAFVDIAEQCSRPITYVIEREAGANRDADIRQARDLIETLLTSSGSNAS